MPLPIPLHCIRPNTQNLGVGTGFVVKSGNSKWLVTSVHLVSGLVDTPADLNLFTSVSFQVVGKNVRLALQTGVSGRCSIANDPSDGMFFDAMSVKLSGFEAVSLAAYGFYEVNSIVAATVGEKIVMTGFPGMKLHPKSATLLGAVVTQVEGVSVAVSKAGQPGLSGGPATTSSGLVGLVQGTTKTPTEGLITSLLLLKPVLFS